MDRGQWLHWCCAKAMPLLTWFSTGVSFFKESKIVFGVDFVHGAEQLKEIVKENWILLVKALSRIHNMQI